jgi:uncharacterized protein YjbI with pentapeptide repeats
VDLRGISLPDPSVRGNVVAARVTFQAVDGVLEVRGARWASLDLAHARLPSLRFFDSSLEGCRFEGAACRDWRLWNSSVTNCVFEGADLRDAAIGTWHEGCSNTWRGVSFDSADLRGALLFGCMLSQCTFRGARLSAAQFLQATIQDSVFSGALTDVLFDGRDLPGKPSAGPLRNVDFSGASFADVEFRGCRFENVRLPETSGVWVIPQYPKVARRALALVEDVPTIEGRMFAGELRNALKLPGADDSIGVFNRADYVVAGGEALAELAESVVRQARADVGC